MLDYIRNLLRWGGGDPQSWAGHFIGAAAIATLSAPIVGVPGGVWAAVLFYALREAEQDFRRKVLDSVIDYIAPIVSGGLTLTLLYTIGFGWTLWLVVSLFAAWNLWYLFDRRRRARAGSVDGLVIPRNKGR